MTVAIGLVCSDGVIVASDSMASSGNVATTAQKVRSLFHLPVVWTAAGTVYVIEEVEVALDALDHHASTSGKIVNDFTAPRPNKVRESVWEAVHPVMKRCYESALPGTQLVQTPQGPVHPFRTDFLLIGYANSMPYFLEIAGDGQVNWHSQAGFYAVGSGGDFASVAKALMSHYVEGTTLSLEEGLMVAHRTIETTCAVSSSFVRPPVQLALVNKSGPRVLNREEVEEVKQGVAGWKQLERETIRMLRSEQDQQGALEEPPNMPDDEAAESEP